MMSARKVIVTATGRVIRNLTIFSVYDMIYLFTEEQGAGSRERRAGSGVLRAGSGEQGAESRVRGAGS